MSNNDSPANVVRQEKSPHFRSIHPIGHVLGTNEEGDVKIVFFSDGVFIPESAPEDEANLEPVHLYEVELYLQKDHALHLANVLGEATNADADANNAQ